MDRAEALKKLEEIITLNLELEVTGSITEEHRLFEDLSIDSIMVLQLIVYIEEEFNVMIPEEGISPDIFLTIGSLISLIGRLQAEQSPSQV